MQDIKKELSKSNEPSVRYRLAVGVTGLKEESPEVKQLQEEIRSSARVKTMLAPRSADDAFRGMPIRNGRVLFGRCWCWRKWDTLRVMTI